MVNWPYVTIFGPTEDEYEPVESVGGGGGGGWTSQPSRMSANQRKGFVVVGIAALLVVGFISANDNVTVNSSGMLGETGVSLPFISTSKSEDSEYEKPCKGWEPLQFIDVTHCEKRRKDGLETSLRTALQNENCEAAQQSKDNAMGVASKLEKLSSHDVFTFFRGTAAMFDVDVMCYDDNFQTKFETMPRVFSNGDCHPENFGVMVQANKKLIWGVNDFDQSFQTPFAWDIKRGATGFELACAVQSWDLSSVCEKSAREFARSYVNTITKSNCEVKNQERFMEGSDVTKDFSTIESIIRKSRASDSKKNSKEWFKDKNVDIDKEEFTESEKVQPLPKSVIPEFQRAIDAYLYNGVAALAMFPNDGKFYKVKAVAKKYGSGTGSIGLDRYYVLIGGRHSRGKYGHIILEMKEEVRSMMQMFFRYQYTASQEGKRAVDSERSAYPYANVFYGWTSFQGKAFIIREKSKHAKSVDLEDLTPSEFLEYAMAAGKALAHYHIRARCADHFCNIDDDANVDVEICNNIVDYIRDFEGSGPHGKHFGPTGLVEMVADFADVEAVRQAKAWLKLKELVEDIGEDNTESLLKLLDAPSGQ